MKEMTELSSLCLFLNSSLFDFESAKWSSHVNLFYIGCTMNILEFYHVLIRSICLNKQFIQIILLFPNK